MLVLKINKKMTTISVFSERQRTSEETDLLERSHKKVKQTMAESAMEMDVENLSGIKNDSMRNSDGIIKVSFKDMIMSSVLNDERSMSIEGRDEWSDDDNESNDEDMVEWPTIRVTKEEKE